jgi:shikimate kinase
MSLILITGSATSGKTTIANELNRLGYMVYDTEENNLSGWFNKKTKKLAERPQYMSKEWHSHHLWQIDVDKVKAIATNAKDRTIVLCGIARNIDQVLKFCNKVIWLKMDSETIRKRVSSPSRTNHWGSEPYQLEFTISRNQKLEKYFVEHGAILIDATKPLNIVLGDVLSEIT